MPVIEERSQNVQLMRNFSTKIAIESLLGRHVVQVAPTPEVDNAGRKLVVGSCYACSKRRKTRNACAKCRRPVCSDHSKMFAQCNAY